MIRFLIFLALALPVFGGDQAIRRRLGDSGQWPINITFANGIRPLVGSTWSVSGGYAVNTPTYGTNLYSNADFSSAEPPGTAWTRSGNWIITGGVATNSSAAGVVRQITSIVAGDWLYETVILDRTSGSGYFTQSESSFATSGTKSATVRALTTYSGFESVNLVGQIDNISVQKMVTVELLASTLCKRDISASCQIFSRKTESQSGLVLRLNSKFTPTDFVLVYLDASKLIVLSCSNGVYVSLLNTAITFVANATLTASINGTTFKCFYNGSQVGTAITIDDARINNNTYAGVFSTDPANTFVSFSAANSTPSTTAP